MTTLTLPKPAAKVIQTLQQAGFAAYAVGGAVRDMLMHKPTHDWDFTTNAQPEQILRLFPDSFYNNQFGTVGIPQANGEVYEITTYRTEHGYSDRRRPDKITWGTSLEEDLARRDFTINAIALGYPATAKNKSGGKPTKPEIIDPYNGQVDITRKLVRAVGSPDQRFKEDALRLLRAVRMATELQFSIEQQTQAAIVSDSGLITHISPERIQTELLRIVGNRSGADGVLLAKQTGLLSYILPELERCFGVEQKSPKRHHIYDVGTHLVESLHHCDSDDPITRLATLLHDIGKPEVVGKTPEGVITFYNHEIVGSGMVKKIANRLRLSKKDRSKLLKLVRWHQFSVDEHQTDSALRRFIRRVGKENLDAMLALRTADRLGGGARQTSWRTELFKKRLDEVQHQPFSVQDLKVNGHDVMKVLSVEPGPVVGRTLEQLFAEVEQDLDKNNREYLLKRITELRDGP